MGDLRIVWVTYICGVAASIFEYSLYGPIGTKLYFLLFIAFLTSLDKVEWLHKKEESKLGSTFFALKFITFLSIVDISWNVPCCYGWHIILICHGIWHFQLIMMPSPLSQLLRSTLLLNNATMKQLLDTNQTMKSNMNANMQELQSIKHKINNLNAHAPTKQDRHGLFASIYGAHHPTTTSILVSIYTTLTSAIRANWVAPIGFH